MDLTKPSFYGKTAKYAPQGWALYLGKLAEIKRTNPNPSPAVLAMLASGTMIFTTWQYLLDRGCTVDADACEEAFRQFDSAAYLARREVGL